MSTRSTSSKSKMTPCPHCSIWARRSSRCCDRSSPLRQIRVPHFPENRSILSVISCPCRETQERGHSKWLEHRRKELSSRCSVWVSGSSFEAESRALNARDEGLLSCFDNELCCFFRMGDLEEVRRPLDLHDLLCAGALCHELSRRDRKVLVSSAVDEPGRD